jgi:TP901-1 family phage major tail protein
MSAQKGSSFLLKIVDPDNVSPTEFVAVGGFRTKSIKLNQTSVDVTNQDSASKWRELLAGAGIKSLSFSGAGVFIDDAGIGFVEEALRDGTNTEFQITVAGLATFTGLFQVTEFSVDGAHDQAEMYSITLESADQPQWSGL